MRCLTGWSAVPLIAVLALGGGAPAQAQAICSAPHSSPTLAGGGSIGTLPRGTGWVQLSAYAQRSDEFFTGEGDRQRFIADGRVRTTSLYLTGATGLFRGIDVWLQAPFHSVHYEDTGGSRSRTGIGDVRMAVRLSPAVAGIENLPLAIRVGAKVPGGEFPVDATIIPLSEGQRDLEVSIEGGRSFAAVPVYVLGWVGRRWRGTNEEIDRKPGDEVFTHLALGGRAATFHWEFAAEYLQGNEPRHVGVALSSGRRRLVQITPTLGRAMGPGELELTALVPVAGRNLASGSALSVGYRIGWGAP